MNSIKKLVILTLALILSAALAGCNTGNAPTATPGAAGDVYAPHPNNVNFNDRNLTTNFATADPILSMPDTSANAAG